MRTVSINNDFIINVPDAEVVELFRILLKCYVVRNTAEKDVCISVPEASDEQTSD